MDGRRDEGAVAKPVVIRLSTVTGLPDDAGNDDAALDAVFAVVIDAFPGARILPPREQTRHRRLTAPVNERPSWWLSPWYELGPIVRYAYVSSRGRPGREASRRRRLRSSRAGRHGDDLHLTDYPLR